MRVLAGCVSILFVAACLGFAVIFGVIAAALLTGDIEPDRWLSAVTAGITAIHGLTLIRVVMGDWR